MEDLKLIYPFEQEANLLQSIIARDVHKSLLNGKLFLNELDKYDNHNFLYIKSCVLYLIVFLIRSCFQMGFRVEELLNANIEHAATLMRAQSLQEIRTFLSDFIRRLLNSADRAYTLNKYEVVMKAKKYINCHFHKTITLEEVAHIVHLSPCYFSRLFSEVSGYTFQEYLTKVRINAAQKLLLDKNLSLEEVADLLGYKNVSYFIRVFKKEVGLTPRQFAQSIGV